MERKAILNKPYTDRERADFISKYNYQQGLKIEETQSGLIALGLDENEITEEKKARFEKEFFKTSLGYIKRQVLMKEGYTKSFLGDLLPLLKTGVTIIAYDKPDFTKEVEDKDVLKLQKQVVATDEFLKECQRQVIVDFYGYDFTGELDKAS